MLTHQGAEVPTSFATVSLGSVSGQQLPEKLQAIRSAGFEAIELGMPDLLEYGQSLTGHAIAADDYNTIATVAETVRALSYELNLKILMLQPFANFEGWKVGRQDSEREDAFNRARGWIKVMQAAGTDMLQIGSSDALDISSSFDDMARDLGELADIMAEKGLRIAYENWAWGTYASTWSHVWQIVKTADRPNLGLCLDTFQSAGGEYADPTTYSGLIEDISRAELSSRWENSIQELQDTIPPHKIFLLQISDGYKMSPPLKSEINADGQKPRSQWSHDFRPLPNRGGYLPIKDFLKAVLATGFRGPLSVEVFDYRQTESKGELENYTKDAMSSLHDMLISVSTQEE